MIGIAAMKPGKSVTKRRRRRKDPSPDSRWNRILNEEEFVPLGKPSKNRRKRRSDQSPARLEELGGMLPETTTAERLFAILRESREDEE